MAAGESVKGYPVTQAVVDSNVIRGSIFSLLKYVERFPRECSGE